MVRQHCTGCSVCSEALLAVGGLTTGCLALLIEHSKWQSIPGGRIVLGDVRLSFLRGAKIGVLGVNGSGKSTLLKVISGKCEQRREGRMEVGYLTPHRIFIVQSLIC